VAGESAVNVSPESAAVHRPSMNIPVLLDATRAFVVDHHAHQIPDRDDSHRFPAVGHPADVRKPPWIITAAA